MNRTTSWYDKIYVFVFQETKEIILAIQAMDVLLAAASLGLSTYLPQCVQPPQNKAIEAPPPTIRLAATLSFVLLALSIIDSVPVSWMLLLNEQLLPTAYRIILVLLVSSVLILFPADLGARLVSGTAGLNSEETKWDDLRRGCSINASNPFSVQRCRRPTPSWMSWFCWQLWALASNLVLLAVRTLFINPLYRLLGKRPPGSGGSGSVLPTTVSPSPTSGGGGSVFFSPVTPAALHLRILPMLGSVVAVAVTITTMSTVSPWFVRTTSLAHHSFYTMPFLSVTVSWLCSVGIFLSSIVNGFGSVSLPYSCLAGLYLEPISDEAVSQAQQELTTARQSIADREKQLAQINSVAQSPSSLESPSSIGEKGKPFLSAGWSFSFNGSDDRQGTRKKQLAQEIEFLTTLTQELEQEIFDMRQSKEMAAQARTPWGRIRSWIGVVFSVILVLRLMGAAWFIWKHDHPGEGGSKGASSDPVTMTVLWLIGHNYVSQQQYNTLSQVISLLLTAYLSMAQVRTFVRAVDAVHRRLQQCWRPCYAGEQMDDSSMRFVSLHGQLRSSAYAPLIASLMCCYFLACVVLTKLLVPAAYRRALALALETTSMHPSPSVVAAIEDGDEQLLRFFLRIRSYAVNSVFLVTALVSTVALGMMLGLKRHQSMRHRPTTPVVLIESP